MTGAPSVPASTWLTTEGAGESVSRAVNALLDAHQPDAERCEISGALPAPGDGAG